MLKRCSTLLFFPLMALSGVAQTPGSMNIGAIVYNHWPSPSPSIMRPRWGAEWRQIETARGTYSFTIMDHWIATAQKNNAQILFTFLDVPKWESSDTTIPPADLNSTNETCQAAPLAGVVRPDGNCVFAEFVTALMQHVCAVTSPPRAPLKGTCSIRIFESWNELNDGQFWNSNYTDMAKMANDAATIIRQYCGDCTVLAGNTSAGGDGYNANYYHNPSVSGRFDLALGQLLDAWHALPNASLPNAVSFHAYGARRNVIPYPMPETNVSQGSSLCTAANVPNPNCRTAVFDETAAVRTVLQARSWAANLPIWNSEGGLGRNDDLTDGVSQTDWNTNFLRQAYVARWMLAMGSSGTVTNLWYEFDDPCWGTMMGYGTPASSTGCPSDPAIPSGFTPIHQTWVQMLSFLSGASFNGPCSHSNTIWSCTITKAGQRQKFIWTTQWLSTSSVTIDPSYKQYVDLAGVVHPINGTTVTVSNQPILLQPHTGPGILITPTVTVSPSSSSITTADPLDVTVAVDGGTGNSTPSGTLTLASGSYTSGASALSSGSAVINIPAGTLAAGNDTLTASYSGDTTYNPTDGAASVIVTSPVSPSFTVSGTAVSVVRGATASNASTVTVTPAGGFTGSVALSASITSGPTGAQYPPVLNFGSTSPVVISSANPGTASLVISTTAATSAAVIQPKRPGAPWYIDGVATLACILIFATPAHRRRWSTILGMATLLVPVSVSVLACGGGGMNPGPSGGTRIPGTTAGTYSITVTGTSGSLTATGAVTLTVQ